MKIAVTASENKGLDSSIDLRFGRASYFAVVDTDTMEVEMVENGGTGAAHGAGVRAAQTIADKNVDAVISGNFGPKAFSGLAAAKVKLYSCKDGTIEEAVESLKKGELKEIGNPTSGAHSGLN